MEGHVCYARPVRNLAKMLPISRPFDWIGAMSGS